MTRLETTSAQCAILFIATDLGPSVWLMTLKVVRNMVVLVTGALTML
jgi:hypothetical protein